MTAPAQGAATRLRQLFARGFLVLAAVLLPVGVIAGWASATLYDSGTFSRRAGNLLRSAHPRSPDGLRVPLSGLR